MTRILHPRPTRRTTPAPHRSRAHPPTPPRLSTPRLPGSDWPTTPRDVAVASTAGAALVSALLGILLALNASAKVDVTLTLVLFPLVASGATVTAVALWGALRRRSSATGLVAAALVLGVGAALQAALFALGWPSWSGGARWMLVAAAVYAAGATLLARLPRTALMPGPRAPRAYDDERWRADAAVALRAGGMPESRVQAVVTEAVELADAAGRPLVDELGAPARYAASLGPGTAARARGSAWHLTIIAGVVGALAASDLPDHGWSPSALDPWATAAFVALAVWAGLAWRAAWRARRAPRS